MCLQHIAGHTQLSPYLLFPRPRGARAAMLRNIFFVCKGNAHLPKGHMLSMFSAVHHHPFAHIWLYSNTLDVANVRTPFVAHGFGRAFRVVRYDLLELTANTPAARLGWLFHDALARTRDGIGRWNFTAAGAALKTLHLTTQFSDWLRVLLLWRYGGLYLDFDVLVLSDLLQHRNLFGVSIHRSDQWCVHRRQCGNRTCDWPRTAQGLAIRCMCNAIIVAEARHPLLRGILEASLGVFHSCLGTGDAWTYYTCLTGSFYPDLIQAEQERFHLERTFTAVGFERLFCTHHNFKMRNRGYWDRKDPQGEHARNVTGSCFAFHRLNSGGFAGDRLLALRSSVGERLVAAHTTWPEPRAASGQPNLDTPREQLHPSTWASFDDWTCWHDTHEPGRSARAARREVVCGTRGARAARWAAAGQGLRHLKIQQA